MTESLPLGSAVELLRRLPRRRDCVPEARSAFAAWADEHPGSTPQLVVEHRPASPVVDYDLLLDHPEGGTVALTVQPSDGVPWAVDHSTHWAADMVATVNGRSLSLPDGLATLRALHEPTGYEQLLDHCLLRNAVADDDEPVDAEEAQAAADSFRRGRGLLDEEATLAYLAARGVTLEMFQGNIETAVRVRRFRDRKAAELAARHLAAHRADFATVRAVWVESDDQRDLVALVDGPAKDFPVRAVLAGGEVGVFRRTAYNRDLPRPLRLAEPGALVATDRLIGQVLHRIPAREDDPRVVAAAGRVAFAEWLAEQRSTADVQWHWR
ncbi:TIGR04500 family putative peptide maturation system protein [Streptosporangium carneum]|uniref:Peptide maturation system protein n=1 Tax=Streptosporangium carneum TaxID=47481 RepID=A0A9W6I4N0_9ACTN|nr:TIGR04500 family putative peptide maturation system protein [Streptosporangium carneum]GLK11613.1 hypothetical protein GCM10017600_50200 [Streptosporangium carneum]